MTFTDYVQTVTQDKIVPKVVDTILGGNVVALRFLANGKPWSGEQMKFPIKYVKNSTSQGAFDGFDTFDTTKVNTRTKLAFNPSGYYQSIVLSGMEVDVNDTEAKVLDLVKTEMESGMQDMLDSLGTAFYTAQSGKSFLSLADIVDDGTTVTTYGGLARATYTTVCGTKTAATAGKMSLSYLGTLYDSASVGSETPTLGVTTEAVWRLLESLYQPTINGNVKFDGYSQVTRTSVLPNKAALRGEVGFDALFFNGTPVVRDEKCTSGYFYWLNEKTINWYGLKSHKYSNISLSSSNIEGVYAESNVPKSYGFCWTGLKEPVNQYAEIGQIILMGNLIGSNPRLNSMGTGITAV